MALTRNKTKSELSAGHAVFGSEVMFPSPDVVEILGYSGLDFAYIDTEHSSTSLESMAHMIRAAEISGATPLVRLPENPRGEYGPQIMRVLDLGAMGVIIPQVDTAEVAEAVVQAVKYHPRGNRGMFDVSRQSGYGFALSGPEYIARANDETLVVVMIESAVGVRNISSILEVPGIDVILIGSSDLSQSLGRPSDLTHPDVVGAIDTVMSAAQTAGVATGVGSFASFPEPERRKFVQEGARFFNVTTANLLVAGVCHWAKSLSSQGVPLSQASQR
jgi:4-hydroxy-2-oxoheptanedioate aldolase